MESIAFIWGRYMVYWSTAIVTMACGVGMLLFLFLYLWDEEDYLGGFWALPLSLGLGMLGARLAHWYFRRDAYESLAAALTDYSVGGFLLAGAGAIALGRLSCLTNSSDRGAILPEGSFWGGKVLSVSTGAVEYRFNTFAIQAVLAGVILAVLLVVYFLRRREYHRRPGDLFWLFCLYYGGTQAVLDSTRIDSTYFLSNGFVSVTQVLGLAAVVTALVCFTVRYLKTGGWKPGAASLWVVSLLFLGGAGYMEYYVQRHGSQAAFAYSVMAICMGLVLVLGTILWSVTRTREIPRSRPTVYESLNQGDFE